MSTKKREAPTEPFKRAVAGCVRAVAGKRDIEVAFAADRPLLLATKVRLPEPPRRLTMQEAAITRGLGDAMALRLACHDGKVHRRYLPGGTAGARDLRRGRAGSLRGARLAPHGRRPLQPHRYAAGPLPPRQSRRHHRAVGSADGRRSRADGARAPDRRGAAESRAQGGRALARGDRDEGRRRARPARHDG